jgi:hypothetical protein
MACAIFAQIYEISGLAGLFAGLLLAGLLDFNLDQPQYPVRQASAIVFGQAPGLLLQLRIDPDVDYLFF